MIRDMQYGSFKGTAIFSVILPMRSRDSRIEKKTNTNPKIKTLTFRDRLSALQNVPRFFKLVWQTSPMMTIVSGLLRIIRSAIPLAILWVGKLIIDEVVMLH